jgi:hypothetical protein
MGKAKKDNTFDWVDVLEQALQPRRRALPRTPTEDLANKLRERMLARPDAARAVTAWNGVLIGVRAEREKTSAAAKKQTEKATSRKEAMSGRLGRYINKLYPIAKADLTEEEGREPLEREIVQRISDLLPAAGFRPRKPRTVRGYLKK